MELLEQLFSSEGGENGLEQMLGMMLGGETDKEKKEGDSSFSPEKLLPLIAMLGQSGEDDERCALLYALKPYLSEKRQEQVDLAVKLISLAKMKDLLKELAL